MIFGEIPHHDYPPPALTRRVVRALELAHGAFGTRADWYFFCDDDTFVRLKPLRARLAMYDASVPMMLVHGRKDPVIHVGESQKLYAQSAHCVLETHEFGHNFARFNSKTELLR